MINHKYASPMVFIELSEYQDLKNRIRQIETSHEEIPIDVHRGLTTALLQSCSKVPDFSLQETINLVKDAITKNYQEEGFKLHNIQIVHEYENPFVQLVIEYEKEGKRHKINI